MKSFVVSCCMFHIVIITFTVLIFFLFNPMPLSDMDANIGGTSEEDKQ